MLRPGRASFGAPRRVQEGLAVSEAIAEGLARPPEAARSSRGERRSLLQRPRIPKAGRSGRLEKSFRESRRARLRTPTLDSPPSSVRSRPLLAGAEKRPGQLAFSPPRAR